MLVAPLVTWVVLNWLSRQRVDRTDTPGLGARVSYSRGFAMFFGGLVFAFVALIVLAVLRSRVPLVGGIACTALVAGPGTAMFLVAARTVHVVEDQGIRSRLVTSARFTSWSDIERIRWRPGLGVMEVRASNGVLWFLLAMDGIGSLADRLLGQAPAAAIDAETRSILTNWKSGQIPTSYETSRVEPRRRRGRAQRGASRGSGG